MFTNWLTSTTATSTSSLTSAAVNMGALPPTVITTPPDIILEVGPSTPSARFVAHSIVLAMHSGYLRSAIRLDENGVPNSELPIYLTNVTPEQFSPLLTYMYTGYLDLNIENIFGVLLATHVLHMPRALEICRNFLSRMQAEGYLSGAFLSHLNETNNNNNSTSSSSLTTNSSVKVIRPIASKPTISNLGFIVPPMPHISLPSTGTPFRSLNNQNKPSILSSTTTSSSSIMKSSLSDSRECDNTLSPLQNNHFTSSKSITKDSSSIIKRSPKLKRPSPIDKSNKRNTNDSNHHHHHHHHHNNHQTTSNVSRKESLSSSSDNENKIIIDVASCDGPVRFRRVLNDAYGKQPQTIDLLHAHSHERTHQSVSHSFHQQMAKNISQQHHHRQQQQQQQHQQQQHSEESENSEDSSTKSQNIGVGGGGGNGVAGNNSSGEVYNCVYCKHTFKSQYCYQKHAKRHLNPLSLEANDCTTGNSVGNISAGGGGPVINNQISSSTPPPPLPLASLSDAINDKDEKITQASSTIITSNRSNSGITGDLKREVRPLDMNVQYYPCKTCGSKFPSYYFVHKHRKMCHANEEN